MTDYTQILAMLDTITAKLNEIGEQVERIGEALEPSTHLADYDELVLTSNGTKWRRRSDTLPFDDDDPDHER